MTLKINERFDAPLLSRPNFSFDFVLFLATHPPISFLSKSPVIYLKILFILSVSNALCTTALYRLYQSPLCRF